MAAFEQHLLVDISYDALVELVEHVSLNSLTRRHASTASMGKSMPPRIDRVLEFIQNALCFTLEWLEY